jgi:hypothetical protein
MVPRALYAGDFYSLFYWVAIIRKIQTISFDFQGARPFKSEVSGANYNMITLQKSIGVVLLVLGLRIGLYGGF